MFVRAPVGPIGGDRKQNPTEIVDKTAAKDEPTGNWPDCRAIDELVEVIGHFRVNCELAKIGGRLDCDDPDIGTPNPAPGGSSETDMMPWMQVVFREGRPPAAIVCCSSAVQNG